MLRQIHDLFAAKFHEILSVLREIRDLLKEIRNFMKPVKPVKLKVIFGSPKHK